MKSSLGLQGNDHHDIPHPILHTEDFRIIQTPIIDGLRIDD